MIAAEPQEIERTGDDRAASGLVAFVWRMSGWRQVGAAALALTVAALSVIPLELQRRMIDDAILPQSVDLLMTLGTVYLCAEVAHAMTKYALRLYQSWLSESATLYCRRHLSGLSGDEDRRGSAVSVIGAEIDQVGGFVGPGISDPLARGGTLLALLGYMLWVEPQVAAVALVFLLPQVLIAVWLQRRLNYLVAARVVVMRRLSDIVARGRTDGPVKRLYRNRMRFYALKFGGKALLNLINALAPLAVLVVGGLAVIDGETQLGTVIAFTTGFARMSDPVRDLIAHFRLAAQLSVKHRMIADWIEDGDGGARG